MLHNQPDSTDQTVALLELPNPTTDTVSATVLGRMDSAGQVIDNPADIVSDLLTRCGIALSPGRLSEFRAECAAENIVMAGVISDADQTLLATITSLMEQIGAVWSMGVTRIAAFYPALDIPPERVPSPKVTLSALRISQASITASADELATRLEIRYRKDWRTNQALETAILDANTQERFGIIQTVIDAPWVTNRAAALSIARRLLMYRCAPRWQVSFETDGIDVIDLCPTDTVAFEYPYHPGRPDTGYFILDAQTDLSSNAVRIDLEIPMGIGQAVTLVALNTYSAGSDLELSYAEINGKIIFTVFDAEGKPIPHAHVTIAGQSRLADSFGTVEFLLPPGNYLAQIEAAGYPDQTLEVTVNRAVAPL